MMLRDDQWTRTEKLVPRKVGDRGRTGGEVHDVTQAPALLNEVESQAVLGR